MLLYIDYIHCTGLVQLFTNRLYTGPALCIDTWNDTALKIATDYRDGVHFFCLAGIRVRERYTVLVKNIDCNDYGTQWTC